MEYGRDRHLDFQPPEVQLRSQVAGVKGKLTIWVNGNRNVGNPADIRLRSHEDVQIDIGAPVIGPKAINRARCRRADRV